MFILLRRIERWLHQHVFKVGWLVTHNYQTTTILYYTIFLPGVFLHELIYWLIAGALGVHAKRSIKWPEQQEIGELKLNFVQISNRAGFYRKALISIAPMILGLALIWYIAANVFDIMRVVSIMSSGDLRNVAAAIDLLLGAPLFWLWIYIIFTVANTMYPTITKDLSGWRIILLGIGAVILVIVLLGIGGEVFEVLQTPVSSLIAVLQTILALIIAIDILMVLVLGTIEYTIERVTGHSATIQGGKLVTVTRQEAQDEQQKVRDRERRRIERQRNKAANSGPSSVYLLPFSIPGAPGEELITKVVEEPIEAPVVEEEKEVAAAMPLFGGLAEGVSEASTETPSEEDKKRREKVSARIKTPERRPPVPAPSKAKPVDKKEEKAPQKPAKVSQPSTIGTKGDDKLEDKPKSPAARFGKPVAPSKSDETSDDKPKSPAARFGKPLSPSKSDETSDEKSKSPAVSRFGSTLSRPKPTQPSLIGEIADDKLDKKSKSPAARFGKPVAPSKSDDKSEENPKSPAARFGKPLAPSKSDDKVEENPKSPVVSRFGSTLSRPKPTQPSLIGDATDDKVEEKPKSPAARFGKPLAPSKSDETSDEKPKSPAARFGSPFARPKPTDTDEEKIEDDVEERPSVVVGRPATASRLTELDEEDEEITAQSDEIIPRTTRFGINKPSSDDEAEQPQTKRFGASPFSRSSGEIEDKNKRPAASLSASRFGNRKPIPEDEDEDDEELDASILRQSRGKDAISSLFSGLNEDAEDEDEDESSTSFGNFRRPTMSSSTSHFGSSRPAPKPISDNIDDETIEVEDDLVYEDIEDEYIDDDDEEYIDLDD